MRRRLILPALLVLAVLGTAWQAVRADAAADNPPGQPLRPAPPSVATPLMSARRIPLFLQAPEADRRLVVGLEEVVGRLPDRSCVIVTEHGRVLYAFNEDLPMVPASTQKLVLALAALESLGPDAVFTTRVLARSRPVEGVVDGDIWLVGGGDPVVMTSSYADRFEDQVPFTDAARLADTVVEAGLETVTGAVIGDESRFDALRFVETWPERFRPGEQNQAGPLSALSLNDGFSWWHPDNTANGLNTPASDPAAFAAALFDDLLEDRGVVVRRRSQAGVAPLDATVELARIDSPRLADIVGQMLVTSDNTTAEIMLKNMGAEEQVPGTSATGIAAVARALAAAGQDGTGVVTADGSGLDPGNRVTCRALTSMLEDPVHGSELTGRLAVAGQSGTMRRRLAGSSGEGRVMAKTGTLRDVTSLAGQVETVEGRRLSFALLTNAEPLPDSVKRLHDQVVLDLVAYPSGPDVALLKPLPAGR